jgi:hypothetical protein
MFFCVVKKNVLLNITREFGDERQSMCTWNIVKNTTVVSLFHGNHVVGGRKCKINGPKSFLSFIIYYFVITSIILSGICSIQDPKSIPFGRMLLISEFWSVIKECMAIILASNQNYYVIFIGDKYIWLLILLIGWPYIGLRSLFFILYHFVSWILLIWDCFGKKLIQSYIFFNVRFVVVLNSSFCFAWHIKFV